MAETAPEGSAGSAGAFTFAPTEYGPAVERWDVVMRGAGFVPHRHDTYGIGVTVRGLQRFRYRGGEYVGTPGDWHLLHPDELHDGMPGDARTLAYRIFYVDPIALADAAGTTRPPFAPDPLARRGRAGLPSAELFSPDPDALRETEIVQALADLLRGSAGARPAGGRADASSIRRVAEAFRDAPEVSRTSAQLEEMTGLSRWEVSRRFRAVYGVSPSRFRLAQMVRSARRLIAGGETLAAAAARAGFSDQAHFTRAFRAVHGLPPGRWRTSLTPVGRSAADTRPSTRLERGDHADHVVPAAAG